MTIRPARRGCRLSAADGGEPAAAPPQPGAAAGSRERSRSNVTIFCSHDPIELEALQRLSTGWRPLRSESMSRNAVLLSPPRLWSRPVCRPKSRQVRSTRGSGNGIRCPDALAHPVRVHDCLPYHLPGLHHRPCQLARGAGVQLAAHGQSALPQSLPLLGEGVRGLLRPRRRVRHRHELPVRHELVALLRIHRQRARARHRLRGHHGVLPGSGVSRHHALRLGDASATACISSPPAWWPWAR